MAENLAEIREKARNWDQIKAYLDSVDNVVIVDCEAVAVAHEAGGKGTIRPDAMFIPLPPCINPEALLMFDSQQQAHRFAKAHHFTAKCVNVKRGANKASQQDENTVKEDENVATNTQLKANDSSTAAESRKRDEVEDALIDPVLFNISDETE